MDNRSPRSRGILGPRPPPLKVSQDSYKIIKKPPLAPPRPLQPQPIDQQEPSQSQPRRGPVIIYTVSPKIIHTHPNNFMTLVQRLTGKTSTSTTITSTTSSSTSTSNDASCGLISPAARFATTERANNASNELGTYVGGVGTMDQYYHHHLHQQQQHQQIERPSYYHGGILSPGPTSLPLISPDFFSTVGPTDPQGYSSFVNDFNSTLQTSPSMIHSPSSMDLFNNFFDS